MLTAKTRIIATHQIQWLAHADHVIMVKDGLIAAQVSRTFFCFNLYELSDPLPLPHFPVSQ